MSQYYSNFAQTSGFMLRQGDWKYIEYPGYSPQLFNIKDDPEELNNMTEIKSGIAEKMGSKLNKIINTRAADDKAKSYDKESFCLWRKELGEKKYQEAMKGIYSDWGAKQEEKIAKWLEG